MTTNKRSVMNDNNPAPTISATAPTGELIAQQALSNVINSLEFTTKALECLLTQNEEQQDPEAPEIDLVTTRGLCHMLKGVCQTAEDDYARACAAN